MLIDLNGKVVVITGASRGLGRELAYSFAKAGAKTVINYNDSKTDAIRLELELHSLGLEVLMVQADVTSSQAVRRLCNATIEKFGRVDVLINNAGICNDSLLSLMGERQWKDVIDVNLNSVFLCSKVFSKEMIRQGSGKIISISSYKGQVGSEGQVNYSTSKAGIIGFTKALAIELGQFGIAVNAVCPGFIQTDLNKNNKIKLTAAKARSVMPINTNMHDLVNTIIFLASDLLRGVSGQVFNVDSRVQQ